MQYITYWGQQSPSS